jgi:hypothetical protein
MIGVVCMNHMHVGASQCPMLALQVAVFALVCNACNKAIREDMLRVIGYHTCCLGVSVMCNNMVMCVSDAV